MKVLILNPPSVKRYSRDGRCQSEENSWLDVFPPTTFASIAGCVREKYNILVIDCMGERISLKQCMEKVRKFMPDYTVINTSTPTIENDMKVAGAVKKLGSAVIAYGEHVTACYKRILKKYPVDYAILGEPETPIMRILEGKPKAKGVAMKGHDGGIWQEPDLDSLPFPAYDLLPGYRYPLTQERWMFIRSGRGCPFNCTYCIMPMMSGNKARFHSPDYMVRQMEWLADVLDINLYMFWDEVSTLNKKRMLELCRKMIEKGLNKKCKWFCTTRVDFFDMELAREMKKAGCSMVSFGIESGSQKVLDRNKKGINLRQIKAAVMAARKHGLRTIGHFVIGLPGSGIATERKTIELAKSLRIDFAQFYTATPFPGSEFYDEAVKNGWLMGKGWKDIEQGTVAVSYPGFSKKQIEMMRRKAYLEFYLRPYAVYSLLRSVSWRTLFYLPAYALKFFSWMRK